MKRPSIYIFSLLILFAHFSVAQKNTLDSQRKARETTQVEIDDMEEDELLEEDMVVQDSIVYPILSSAAILIDYGKLLGQFMDTEKKYEVGLQIDIKNKIVFFGEFGGATLTPNGAYQNAQYVSEGNYYRVGLGYKIDMNPKNNIVFSARYGQSFYSDKGEITVQSESGLYDPFVEPFEGESTTAHWYEFVITSEARLWKGLYTGFHMRLRVLGDYEERVPLDVYSIPGYGRTIDKTIPALNLYVKYALEWF